MMPVATSDHPLPKQPNWRVPSIHVSTSAFYSKDCFDGFYPRSPADAIAWGSSDSTSARAVFSTRCGHHLAPRPTLDRSPYPFYAEIACNLGMNLHYWRRPMGDWRNRLDRLHATPPILPASIAVMHPASRMVLHQFGILGLKCDGTHISRDSCNECM